MVRAHDVAAVSIPEIQKDQLWTVEQFFTLVFGMKVSKDVLSQWCHQGCRLNFRPYLFADLRICVKGKPSMTLRIWIGMQSLNLNL